MRSLAEIHALYGEINARLEAALSQALASGDVNLADRTLRKQVLNDQAYFVLSWGQIESEINDRCRDAIVTRQADPRWEIRRAWDIHNPSERRLSGLAFQDRAALVTDRAAGRSGVFAMIMRHYDLRNRIAHGDLGSTRIDIALVVNEFDPIQAQLKA